MKCTCTFSCGLIGTVISAIVGIVLGYYTVVGSLAWIATFASNGVVIALVALAILVGLALITSYYENKRLRDCLCKSLPYAVVGIVGSLIVGTILSFLLASGIAAILTIQIFVGLLALFVGVIISSIICFVICTMKKNCSCRG